MRVLFALLFFPCFVFAQNIGSAATAGDFTVTGNIKGLPDSTMVFLARPGQTGDLLATAYAKNGWY